MWKRKELKEQGKAALKRNYWKSVLVTAVFMALIGGGACGAGYSAANSEYVQNMTSGNISVGAAAAVVLAALLIIIAALALVILVNVLIVNPLLVGINRFKINAVNDKGNVSDLGHGFDCAYKRNIKTLFFVDLYLILWSCLFIIPGIVKSYQYRMIPYILADNPDIDKKEAFDKSKAMMKGNKWRVFVLDLSFILWYLLGSITFGIVSVFYVEPYKQLTDAALYEALK